MSDKGTIVSTTAYAILLGDERQLRLQYTLKQISFDAKLKPFIQLCDGSAKGDWDVGITIDVQEAVKRVDKIVPL